MPGTPRRTRLALALVFASVPGLAAAQPVTRTWNGCDRYVCATYTFRSLDTSGYRFNGFGTFTVEPALAAAGYQTLYAYVCVYGCPPEMELGHYGLAGYYSLVGRAAGDVIPFSTGFIQLQDYYAYQPAVLTLGASFQPAPHSYLVLDGGLPLTLVSSVTAPEPSTIALTFGGLAAIGVGVRRRRAA